LLHSTFVTHMQVQHSSKEEDLTPSARFEIASITKTFVASTLMLLLARHSLSDFRTNANLDFSANSSTSCTIPCLPPSSCGPSPSPSSSSAPYYKIRLSLGLDTTLADAAPSPSFLSSLCAPPHWRSATLRSLLSHTSGIADYWTDPSFLIAFSKNSHQRWNADEILKDYAAKMPPLPTSLSSTPKRCSFTSCCSPSSSSSSSSSSSPSSSFPYAYSDTNYVLIGQLIEAWTGQKLHTVMNETLFQPLGLADTYFPYLQSSPSFSPFRARGAGKNAGGKSGGGSSTKRMPGNERIDKEAKKERLPKKDEREAPSPSEGGNEVGKKNGARLPTAGPILSHRYESEEDLVNVPRQSADWAGGGLVSSAQDLTLFARKGLLGSRSGGREGVSLANIMMAESVLTGMNGVWSSLGLFVMDLEEEEDGVDGRIWGHDGWGHSFMFVYEPPQSDQQHAESDILILAGTVNQQDERADPWQAIMGGLRCMLKAGNSFDKNEKF